MKKRLGDMTLEEIGKMCDYGSSPDKCRLFDRPHIPRSFDNPNTMCEHCFAYNYSEADLYCLLVEEPE